MVSTKIYRDIETLKGIPNELFVFRFVQIMLENGLMEPWMIIFCSNETFRILS